MEKDELEKTFLELQIKDMQRPWHARPVLLIGAVSTGFALLGFLVQGFVSRYESAAAKIDLEKARTERVEAERLTRGKREELTRLEASYALLFEERNVAERTLQELKARVAELPSEDELRTIQQSISLGNTAAQSAVSVLSDKIRTLRERTREAHSALVRDGTKARLFFFIRNDEQRRLLLEIEDELNDRQFYLANIIKNKWVAPATTEVRYFRRDEDDNEAQLIAETMGRDFGWKKVRVVYVDDPASVGEGRKYQIWLAEDELRVE